MDNEEKTISFAELLDQLDQQVGIMRDCMEDKSKLGPAAVTFGSTFVLFASFLFGPDLIVDFIRALTEKSTKVWKTARGQQNENTKQPDPDNNG